MKDIEQFLRDNAPETPDEGQFMIETNARLNAVEGIKQSVDGEHRRARTALIISLATGLVIGCLLTLLVVFYPVRPTQWDSSVFMKAIETLQEWKELLFILIAALAITLGLLFVTRKREAF